MKKILEFVSEVPSQIPHPDKDKILLFMKHGRVGAVAAGFARDMLTGELIPGGWCMLEACGYIWSSKDVWHFEQYNFTLPEDFILLAREHCLDHLYERLAERKRLKSGGTDE